MSLFASAPAQSISTAASWTFNSSFQSTANVASTQTVQVKQKEEENVLERNFSDSEEEQEFLPGQLMQLVVKEKKKKHDKKKSSHKEKHSKDNSRKEKIKALEAVRISSNSFRESKTVDSSLSYYFDLDGDYNNAVYESLNRSDIPTYYRDYETVVGSKFKSRNILSLQDKDVRFLKLERYFGETNVIKSREKNFRVLKINPKSDFILEDYVSFSFQKDELSDNIETEINQNVGETFDEWFVTRNSYFNSLTQSEPNNIQHWKDFLDFQDEAHLRQRNRNLGPLYSRKISILESCMLYHSENPSILALYMNILGEYSSKEFVQQKWTSVIEKFPDCITLVNSFIDFHLKFENPAVIFGYLCRIVRDRYAFHSRSVLKVGPRSSVLESLQKCEDVYVSIIIRWASLLHSSGKVEFSVSIFIALLEFNIFRPDFGMNKIMTDRLCEEFAIYWESDVPRFGEYGSNCWDGWYKKLSKFPYSDINEIVCFPLSKIDSMSLPTIPIDISLEENLRNKNIVKNLIHFEKDLCFVRLFPLRGGVSVFSHTGETVVSDDSIERVVLFSDISPALFDLSLKGSIILLYSFLSLLGLPSFCVISPYSFYSLLENEYFELSDGLSGPASLSKKFKFHFHMLPDYLNNEKRMSEAGIFMHKENTRVCLETIDLVFNTLISRNLPDQMLFISYIISYMSFAFHSFDLSAARKISKRLLKMKELSDDFSYLVWITFSVLELRYGDVQSSMKVLNALLQSPLVIPLHKELLLNCYRETLLVSLADSSVSVQNVLTVLSANVDETCFDSLKKQEFVDINPPKLILIRRSFIEFLNKVNLTVVNEMNYQNLLPPILDKSLSLWISFAWFQYFTAGLESSVSCFNLVLKNSDDNFRVPLLPHDWQKFLPANLVSSCNISVKSKTHCWVFEQLVALVCFHCRRFKYTAPKVLRQTLEFALTYYPENGLFLSLYVEVQKNGHATHRLRLYFDKCLSNKELNSASGIVILHAFISEFDKLGSSHRIRTLFEKIQTVQSQNNFFLISLWRLYIKHEVFNGSKITAKKLFYRAISYCNTKMSKLLWLDCLTWLAPLLSEKENQEILDALTSSKSVLRWNCTIQNE